MKTNPSPTQDTATARRGIISDALVMLAAVAAWYLVWCALPGDADAAEAVCSVPGHFDVLSAGTGAAIVAVSLGLGAFFAGRL